MTSNSVGWTSRILGGLIGAGGTWFAIDLSGWGLDPAVAGSISGAMGLAGLVFGAKIWELVVSLA
jgi:hypothetical protein